MKLEGRVTLVMGGASGIGKACAEACAAEGSAVVIADVDEAQGQEVAADLRERHGAAVFVTTDITDELAVVQAVALAVDEFGELDVLVTSAGGGTRGEDIWQRSIDLYLKGPFYACKHAAAAMEHTGGGSIVNIASVGGIVGSTHAHDVDGTGYSTAKHGVVGMTKTIALAYAKRHIRANAICPGDIRTPLNQHLRNAADDGAAYLNEVRQVPMGRWGEPHEIGSVAAFLASDEASFITGQAIVVDGGLTAH